MTARLVALAGPLEGRVVPLPEDGCTIGRDDANTICLPDLGVSRQHCRIEQQDGQFVIRDLGSQNCTYLNDTPVKESGLEHGDEFRIGVSAFVFLIDGLPVPPRQATVDLDDGSRVRGTRLVLPRSDALYLHPETLVDGVPQSQPIARIVKSILKACQAVCSVQGLEELEGRLLESILDSIPARRAAILLFGRSPDEVASARHWISGTGERKSFRIPRAVVESVLKDHTALCINDILESGLLRSETMVQAGISSTMAVPLVVSDAVVGTIYLDASDPSVRFGEDDLQLLTGIGEVSAAPLARALRLEQLERDNERLLAALAGDHALVGGSDRMREVRRFIAKVAASDATVLISGATGTGKELVARAIHRSSARAGQRFVAINCAAVIDTLLESEFFGHEKGAFTNAFAQKKGKLEEAEGGTVFLDEIGELALPLQAKLLRVLQEREFERVGGTRPIKANIRVIAATNRDLGQEVRRGAFRQDLYYRLNVVSLTMPELREHREDIPLLANHFLKKHARTCTRRMAGVSEEAMACLATYDWPGNVRELENAIERAIVLGGTEQILPDDLPDSIVESGVVPSASGAKFHETIKDIKKQLVTRALEQSNGSYVEAAKRLGLHANNLHRLLKTLNLKQP